MVSPHVSVSSENSAKAPTEKHSFDENKSLFTDDDVQRLAMAVKNIMLDDLRKELRQDMHLCSTYTSLFGGTQNIEITYLQADLI
jgi:hypothetical protein